MVPGCDTFAVLDIAAHLRLPALVCENCPQLNLARMLTLECHHSTDSLTRENNPKNHYDLPDAQRLRGELARCPPGWLATYVYLYLICAGDRSIDPGLHRVK